MTVEKTKPTYEELEKKVAALEMQLNGVRNTPPDYIRESDRLEYEKIIEFSRDGCVIFNETGKVLGWNMALEDLTGMTKSEVIGQDLWDVQFDLSYEKGDKSDFIKLAKNRIRDFKTFTGDSLKSVFEYKILCKGSIKSVEEIVFVLNSENGFIFLAILRDITQTRMNEAGMHLANERINHFIDSDIVGIVIATAEGKILMANDYYLNLIGYSRKNLKRTLWIGEP